MPAPVMHFKQRNNLAKLDLKLHSEYVEYYVIDRHGKVAGFNIKYELLPAEFDYQTYRARDSYVTLPLATVALLTLFELLNHSDTYFVIGFMTLNALVLCGIGYGLRRLFKKDYTALVTEAGMLLIVKDGKHDQIVNELQMRRAAALRKMVVVDRLAPPWREVKKFKWLRDEGIISNEDFDSYRDLILASTNTASGATANSPALH